MIGAVIVAAGKSSRMGDFKPMMRLGPLSVAQHVVNAFRQAGIGSIAVVTGRNAEALVEHLSAPDITFLHNPDYMTNEMFDSAKIGLSHMAAHCDRIMFTPVDIPLFSPDTVKALAQTDAPIACPVCSGKQGHPLMLSAGLIPAILSDSGEGGLKGAISRLALPMTKIPVDDPGILWDADTPEEFRRLRERLYPGEQELAEMLDEAQTPEPVRAHGRAVAVKAAALAAQTGSAADLPLLRAACLLHDMAKTQGRSHAAAAADMLRRKGYPHLAVIIEQHHDLDDSPCIEAELLYLADKLVRGTTEITLEERFSASKQKCQTLDALVHWEHRYLDAQRIARQYGLDV